MPIHHAVLAILADGPTHGYDLRAQFREAVGPQWGDLNIGHLNQVLDRLEREGHVRVRPVAQHDRPDKLVYTITKAGRVELEAWLDAPFVRQGGYRDDFFLKLFASARVGERRIENVARVQREAYLSELNALTKLRRKHRDEPLVTLLIDAAILHTRANLKVADLAETSATKLSEARAVLDPVEERQSETG